MQNVMDGCDECMSDIEFIQSIQDESKQEQVWNALRQQQNVEGPLVNEDKKDVAPRYGYDSDYNLYKFESISGSFWYTQVVDHKTAELVCAQHTPRLRTFSHRARPPAPSLQTCPPLKACPGSVLPKNTVPHFSVCF